MFPRQLLPIAANYIAAKDRHLWHEHGMPPAALIAMIGVDKDLQGIGSVLLGDAQNRIALAPGQINTVSQCSMSLMIEMPMPSLGGNHFTRILVHSVVGPASSFFHASRRAARILSEKP